MATICHLPARSLEYAITPSSTGRGTAVGGAAVVSEGVTTLVGVGRMEDATEQAIEVKRANKQTTRGNRFIVF
jgi:hypothetical protein